MVVRSQSFDLFPVHLKVFDFEDDPALNASLVDAARTIPELSSSTSGKSLLQWDAPWVDKLRARYEHGLSTYLSAIVPDRRRQFELESYVFFNHTTSSSFTPVHDHLLEADLVAIYYAMVPPGPHEEWSGGSYYALEEGLLVLHDARTDARIDRRTLASRDHFCIRPKTNRLVIHPASLRHSVTPSHGGPRLAVTCTITVDRRDLFEGYVKHTVEPRSAAS